MKTAAPAISRLESLWSDLAALSKAQLSALVLFTTGVGFIAGTRGPMDYGLFAATLIGTALCAAGAATLNQWWERDLDGLMERTRQRPLPARRIHAADALLLGLFFVIAGLAILGIFTNLRAAFLAFATVTIYVLVYTPMKRVSTLNTLIGAIPGALPPLIGWIAAHGTYDLKGGLLFAILWFWQMPHFLAIAWKYREDYAKAGCVMLPARDPSGRVTGRQAFLYSLCLLMVSLLPAFLLFGSVVYFVGALLLGTAFSVMAWRFAQRRDRASARALFLASIAYLPLLLILFVLTQG